MPSVEIIHGDALECLADIADQSVDAVITDPPYCSGGVTEAGRSRATSQGQRATGRFKWFGGDNMTTAGLMFLLRAVAVEFVRILKPEGHLCVFCDWRMVPMIAPAIESAGLGFRYMVVWDKGHFGMGTGFRPRHEIILHLTQRAPVFHAANIGNVITVKRVGKDREHPTEKPIELLKQLIRVTSPAGGLIVDPFAGSGSTGVAAQGLGRSAIMIEREEGYVDAMRRRLLKSEETRAGRLFGEHELRAT